MSNRGLSDAHFSKNSNNNYIVDTEVKNIKISETNINEKISKVASANNRKKEVTISFEHFNEKDDYSMLSNKIKRIYIPIDEFETNYNIIKTLENRFEIFIEMPLIILQKDIKDYKKRYQSCLRDLR